MEGENTLLVSRVATVWTRSLERTLKLASAVLNYRRRKTRPAEARPSSTSDAGSGTAVL